VVLILLSCAWVLGIYLGSNFQVPALLIFVGLTPCLWLPFQKQAIKPVILACLMLFILIGAAIYYPSSVPREGLISAYNDAGRYELQGTVRAAPELKDQITRLEIAAGKIKIASQWQPINGTILAFVPRYPEYHYGDLLLITGLLETPPQFQTFDYQAYLARRGVFSTMLTPSIQVIGTHQGFQPTAWIYSLRERLAEVLSSTLPEPQASLAQGLVLGIRTSIPDDLKADLSVTGTAQLLAISGINLTIVAGILIALGVRALGRRHYLYVWSALLMIWFYALLTGLQPSVIRAAIMASIFLLAELLGRQKNAQVALSVSAAIMVGLNPQILWDISFQLSFLAMIGLIFISPLLQTVGQIGVKSVLGEDSPLSHISSLITDSLGVTLGAIIAVWPLVAYYFGLVSIVGPFANLIIAPVLPMIILTGTLTSLAGLISAPLSQVIGWTAWVPLSYMLWLTNALANLPMAAIFAGPINAFLIWAYYFLFTLMVLIKINYRKFLKISTYIFNRLSSASKLLEAFNLIPKKFIIIPLLALAIPLTVLAANVPDDKLHVSFLDVGEGDAALIQMDGQNVLIDGGPSPQAVCLGLSSKMPLWQKNIDLMILTHPHLDHLSGLVEVLKRYQVKKVLSANLISNSPTFLEWQNEINSQHITSQIGAAGQAIRLANGVKIEVLNPQDSHQSSNESDFENMGLVLRLSLNKISFLFTADVDQDLESRLISQRSNLGSTVLKVAHHGSKTSTSAEFLSVVNPQAAIISVGVDNNFGHPDSDTVKRLSQRPNLANNLYRTDLNGTVELTTDGEHLWVKTGKQ
jgi:competence protein ComEC